MVADKEGITNRAIAGAAGIGAARYTGTTLAKRQKEGKSNMVPKLDISYPKAIGGAMMIYGVLGIDDDEMYNIGALVTGVGIVAAEQGINGFLTELAKPAAPAGA